MENTKIIFNQLKKFKPEAIVLFGSAARGEAGEDSDLDILLIKQTDKSFSDKVREARSLVRTSQPLDIIVITPQEAKELPKKNSFLSQILKEGKLIYGRI
ncbi:nucleotidyltransferase domain-containing protein [Candidatus Curtissbacteria bacterium]|nr:nucleotidyltransferase domain-containing protein [Candidatus Curtissbacteria bacterium]